MDTLSFTFTLTKLLATLVWPGAFAVALAIVCRALVQVEKLRIERARLAYQYKLEVTDQKRLLEGTRQ